jgi:hypothetical protein
MNNEPVAWMSNEYSVCSKEAYQTLSENARSWYPIPLYTHPAELTDEDLEIITEALLMVGFMDDFVNYDLKEKALAILRKAQENEQNKSIFKWIC